MKALVCIFLIAVAITGYMTTVLPNMASVQKFLDMEIYISMDMVMNMVGVVAKFLVQALTAIGIFIITFITIVWIYCKLFSKPETRETLKAKFGEPVYEDKDFIWFSDKNLPKDKRLPKVKYLVCSKNEDGTVDIFMFAQELPLAHLRNSNIKMMY